MKCPKCGFWNRAQFPKCFQCGYPLDGSVSAPRNIPESAAKYETYEEKMPLSAIDDILEEENFAQQPPADQTARYSKSMPGSPSSRGNGAPPVSFSNIDNMMKEFPVRKAPTPVYGEPIETLEHENIFIKAPAPPIRKKPDAAPPTGQVFKPDSSLSTRKINKEAATKQVARSQPAKKSADIKPIYSMKNRKKRRNFARVFFRVSVLFALVTAIGMGIYIVYPKAVGFISSLKNTGTETGQTASVDFTIEQISKNGRAAREIVFTSAKYESVYIQELKSYCLFTAGEARLLLYDDAIIGDTPSEGNMTVLLTPVFYMPSGRQEIGSAISFDYEVPPTAISLTYPETPYANIQTDITSIKFNVQPGSKVTVNGADVTDFMDINGNVVQNIDTSVFGENEVVITAQAKGHTATIINVTLNRPYMDIPIKLSANTASSSTSKTVELRGETQPGASITLDTSQSGEGVVEADGSFTIKALMTRIGKNDVVIRVSKPGKEDTLYTLTIEYAPKLDEYSKQAWPLDGDNYKNIMDAPTNKVGRVYVGTGTVTDISQDAEPIYTFVISDEIVVLIQMVPGKNIEINKKYKIYCDFDSMHLGKALFIGRYFYEQ